MHADNPYKESGLYTLISEGNEEAFNEFYLSVLPEFSSYLMSLLKSKEAVNDVLQEALIRFWLSRDKLPGIDNPKAWLSRIISNECYRYLRKQSDYQKSTKTLDQPQELEGELLYQTDMDLAFRETQGLIRGIVQDLSPRQKSIYQLSRESGLTIPQIADKLGVSSNYVRKTLVLSLKLIQKRLKEAGVSLPMVLLLLP
ncbi:RNA polymerase sigma factor [Pseudobacter ginsenosidimutans]|uniref:RNA polymerase sigma-70 factor (ECF subfamily) n=1 Tax=Pseudobacter ginsenosidimutans TaxID=661488 RepID=A0A4Q7N0J9_9BACT|nr:sigma-70 family RNA polymerase sigma factor [Pseudobacter ginsenosidimutans]QEC43320.1 sigma-70 family RNA polymerase sigma factor [Pseudobacter ginsenosidimutans]RZS74682.1 RNA polymerase sigma-70 factor (ECF subfamily) [Pseudobacter ginsenosidimutans]